MTPYPRKTSGSMCRLTPMPATTRPPQKSDAEANIAARGPADSTHRPKTAAERPSNTIARLKIQPRLAIVQSPGVVEISFAVAGGHACCAAQSSWAHGLLKTENAYA